MITTVVVKDPNVPGAIGLANKPSDGSFAMVRFAAQATAADITNFLGAHKASMVEGPKPGGLYKVKLADSKLAADEVGKIVKQMQEESKIVSFIAVVQ